MIKWKVGCSGFYNRHWKGIFYPEKLPQNKWFSYYCDHFNTLELNVTFYRFPRPETFDGWYKKSPEGFSFSVKAPRLITHFKKFEDCERLLNDFYTACHSGLINKLKCLLFQLPPGIHYNESKLEQIINALHPEFTNVVEFRHESWWKKNVYDALTEKKTIFCCVNHPKLPTDLIVNDVKAYVRLHGNPRMFYSPYSTETLQGIIDKLKLKKKIKEAYVYFNNTADVAGIVNAQQFQDLLK